MRLNYIIMQLLKSFHRPSVRRSPYCDLVLGTTDINGRKEPVILQENMRTTHLAVMGLSGVGKSYFIEKLVRQDIEHDTGFVVFDVHGDLADRIVAYLAERTCGNEELSSRVVVIEPFDRNTTIGFNPLEQVE